MEGTDLVFIHKRRIGFSHHDANMSSGVRFGNFRGVGAGALRADIQHARRRTGSIRVVSLQACCLMIINDAKIMNASPKQDNLCAGL